MPGLSFFLKTIWKQKDSKRLKKAIGSRRWNPEAPGGYGIFSRGGAARIDAYETTSALARWPESWDGHGALRVHVTLSWCQTFSPWSDLPFLWAGVPLEQVSGHVVVAGSSRMGWTGPWLQWHINCLELLAVLLARLSTCVACPLFSPCTELSAPHVLIPFEWSLVCSFHRMVSLLESSPRHSCFFPVFALDCSPPLEVYCRNSICSIPSRSAHLPGCGLCSVPHWMVLGMLPQCNTSGCDCTNSSFTTIFLFEIGTAAAVLLVVSYAFCDPNRIKGSLAHNRALGGLWCGMPAVTWHACTCQHLHHQIS